MFLMRWVFPKFGLRRLIGVLVLLAFVYHSMLFLGLGLPILFAVEALSEPHQTEVIYSFCFTLIVLSLPLLTANLDKFMDKAATLAVEKVEGFKDPK